MSYFKLFEDPMYDEDGNLVDEDFDLENKDAEGQDASVVINEQA